MSFDVLFLCLCHTLSANKNVSSKGKITAAKGKAIPTKESWLSDRHDRDDDDEEDGVKG